MSETSREPALEIVGWMPEVNVQQAEYQRLLGYPRDFVLADRARELSDWARNWYARHGRPWVYAREADTLTATDGGILLDAVLFSSTRLLKTFRAADAHGAILVAVSAGPEIEREAQKLWLEEKPDEYFFLDVYGSAVVEHLVTMTGARLCAWADSREMAVLPHYSPGYPDWEIQEQPQLLGLINTTRPAVPATLEVFDSGMLRPKKSLLAVFGLTRHAERVRRLTDLIPCHNCSFLPCQYRRAPYHRAPEPSDPELPASVRTASDNTSTVPVLDPNAQYTVSVKALQRWGEERLSIVPRADGTLDAFFQYEGSTCTNMGRPLQFLYHVRLGPRDEGYPIREQQCGPAPGDDGHTFMCRYLSDHDQLLAAIDRERPLEGQSLNDVLAWTRPSSPAGCYCEHDSRQHKWGLVFETIHYALAHRHDQHPVENSS